MNILIIESDEEKRNSIINYIKENYARGTICWVSNYNDAKIVLDECQQYVDLVLLDWNFLQYSTSPRSLRTIGFFLLRYMEYYKINIDTYIIGDEYTNINTEQFPFVKGKIKMDDEDEIGPAIETILGPPNNIIANESQNISFDPSIHVKRKTKTKPKTSGYKRRMSSTPWWMQN